MLSRTAFVVLLMVAASASAQQEPSPRTQAEPQALRIDRELSARSELNLEEGQNRLLMLSEDIGRVAVANPNVADLKVVTPRQLLLTAKSAGDTDLTLWDKANKPLVVTLHVTRNLDALRAQIRKLFPNEDIHLSSAGDLVVLSGTVSDVRIPERVAEVARLHSKEVANLLQVKGDQQVQLEVHFAEVSRSALREMGVNWFDKSRTGIRVGGIAGPSTPPGAFVNSGINNSIPGAGVLSPTGQPPDLQAPQFSDAFSLFFSQNFSGFPVSVMLSLLESHGLAHVLAEPKLVTLSGQQAKFLAGGEIPIPITGGLGQVNVIWKKFGILLSFVPTVIGADTIHLKMSTEVSQIDPTLSVTIAGSTVPGFSTRRSQTTVRLGDGQSFAIAGLLSERTRSQVDRIPLLGSLPILGALFRSTSYRRDETELLVVVTAHLARPLAPKEAPPLPGSSIRPPGDLELFLLGWQQDPSSPGASGGSGSDVAEVSPSGPYGFAP